MKKQTTTMNKHYPIRIDEAISKEMIEVRNNNNVVWSTLIREFIHTKIAEYKSQKQ